MVKIRRDKPKAKQEKHKTAKLSSFLHKKADGRANRYVFKGFYERLTAIRGNLIFGKRQQQEVPIELRPYVSDDDNQVELSSNFITCIYNAPRNNASLEFKKIHSQLQKYTSSYNLVVAKKDEIIDKLIDNMVIEEGKPNNPKLIVSLLDLLISLIKDLRNEISFETLFLDQIFPKMLSMLNVDDLELLEQMFSFFSYCFRYMLPTILKNFGRFYKVYFKVLMHKNKFIKKFAAESFAYVLRKAKRDNLAKMISSVCLNPIRKPYKYISMEMELLEQMSDDSPIEELKDHEAIVYSFQSELVDPAFSKIEKWMENEIRSYKYTKTVEEEEYYYFLTYEEKQFLISTVSTIFSEAVYGVQYKLFTEWKVFIDVLCNSLTSYDQEQAAWHMAIFRYTMVSLASKLNSDAVSELVGYVITKLGEKHLKLKDTTNCFKLDSCLIMIRDILAYKEGKKMNNNCAITIIGFLYKLLKNQVKAEVKCGEKTLLLLIECLYLGYYNKKDQYDNIFNLGHSSKFFDLIQQLGSVYYLHFYCLASVENLNQKYYDLSQYHIMLLNKAPKSRKF